MVKYRISQPQRNILVLSLIRYLAGDGMLRGQVYGKAQNKVNVFLLEKERQGCTDSRFIISGEELNHLRKAHSRQLCVLGEILKAVTFFLKRGGEFNGKVSDSKYRSSQIEIGRLDIALTVTFNMLGCSKI